MDELSQQIENLKISVEKMKNPTRVTLLHSDDYDWVGIHVDGKLKLEGHSLDERMVLEALEIAFRHEERGEEFWNEWAGRCPPTDDAF